MAPLTIHRPPLCGDAADSVPREQWPILIEERQRFCREALPDDCRLLLFFVDDAGRNEWLGYANRDTYVREGLGLDPDLVAWALDGLQRTNPQAAVRFDSAVVLGKQGNETSARDAAGRFKPAESKANNIRFGTSAAYTLARLKRDHPELAAEVMAGRLTANAAAIKAGFRIKTWTAPDDIGLLRDAIARRYPGWRLHKRKDDG